MCYFWRDLPLLLESSFFLEARFARGVSRLLLVPARVDPTTSSTTQFGRYFCPLLHVGVDRARSITSPIEFSVPTAQRVCEKKLNETRHGHTHKSETDKSGARRAGYMDATHCLHHVRANVCCEACVPIVEVVRLCEELHVFAVDVSRGRVAAVLRRAPRLVVDVLSRCITLGHDIAAYLFSKPSWPDFGLDSSPSRQSCCSSYAPMAGCNAMASSVSGTARFRCASSWSEGSSGCTSMQKISRERPTEAELWVRGR